MKNQLILDKVTVHHQKTMAVSGISFSLSLGEIVCILGPSGSGKSTILRAIAGFNDLSSGSIMIGDRTTSTAHFTLPPEQRSVSMVFQDFALFPHLDVSRNISFGLQSQLPKKRSDRVEEMLELINLQDVSHKYPHELSVGQQQRVALGRAMAPNPRLLLLDEPFASLDTDNRNRLAREMRKLLKLHNITTLLVTHDQNEAFALSDQVVLINSGSIQEIGSPTELVQCPTTIFAADFLDLGDLIEIGLDMSGNLDFGLGKIPAHLSTDHLGKRIKLLLRPGAIICDDNGSHMLKIVGKNLLASTQGYSLELPDGQTVHCSASLRKEKRVGEMLTVRFCLHEVSVF